MTKSKTFEVVYERDADGLWLVSVPALQGAHTQGRTVPQARERIREVVALVAGIDEADQRLVERFALGPGVEDSASAARGAREAAEAAQEQARIFQRDAAEKLLGAGLSVRDAGEVLGVSHGWVQKLTAGTVGATTGRRVASGRASTKRASGRSKVR